MKKLLLGIVLSAFSAVGMSQEICGTDLFYEQEYAKDPSFRQVVEDNWALSDGPLKVPSNGRAVKIIPLVFHILHDNGEGNISMEQIQSAVDMLNEDFRRTNADASQTRSVFAPHAADVEVEFRLAKIDPDGNCTNGVVRVNDPDASHEAQNHVKAVSRWPSNMHMNIWVVNDIQNFTGQGIILGYAQFPGSGSWNTYGVVIRHDRVGRVGTAGFGDRTLTHELGHCLNLLHTFQSGCGNSCSNSGDRVCDTPPSFEATYGCNSNQNTCSNDASGSQSVYGGDVVDQIENYMSYDQCQNMFSEGQKTRVQNVLAGQSVLVALTSSANLTATGVLINDPGVCVADFESNNKVVCMGETVDFTDLSYHNPQAHNWTFEGGYPNTSTDQNPSVTYNKPGVYEVSLSITDASNNSVSTTKQAFITVLSSIDKTSPVNEDYESAADLTSINWFGEWQSETDFGWLLHSGGGVPSGQNAAKLNAYGNTGSSRLESPIYDLSNLASATLKFKTAYASIPNASGSNLLRVYVSADCGETWKLKYVNGNAALASRADMNTPYSSPQVADFVERSVNLEPSLMAENVRVRFEFSAERANNLYIDDINIEGPLSNNLVLRFPLNQSDEVPKDVTFNWNAVNSAQYYVLEFDTSSSFNSPMYQTHQKAYLGTLSNQSDTKHDAVGLLPQTQYFWRVATTSSGSQGPWSSTWSFTTGSDWSTSVNENLANSFSVNVFPNPANGYVNIALNMSQSEYVSVEVLTLSGRLVQRVFNSGVLSGMNNIGFDATGWASGIYMVRIQGENHMEVIKLIID